MEIMTQTELIVRKICPLDTEGRQLRHNGNCFTEQTAHGHQINTACTISHQKDTLMPSYQTYGLYALQTSAVWLLMSRKCRRCWLAANGKQLASAHSPSVLHIMQYMVGLVLAVLGKNAEKVKMHVEKKLGTTNISLPIVANESYTYTLYICS